MLMKKITLIIIPIVLGLYTISCSLFGPSEQDVMDALNPVWKGFASVPIFQDHMAEEFQYNDTVEMFNENDDQTITQKSSFSIDRTENYLSGEGICNFDNFSDDMSGYTISGSIEYSMSGSMDETSDALNLEFTFDLTYDGGDIKSIAFTMSDEIEQSNELPEFIVNGKSFQFKEDLKNDAFRLLKNMNVM